MSNGGTCADLAGSLGPLGKPGAGVPYLDPLPQRGGELAEGAEHATVQAAALQLGGLVVNRSFDDAVDAVIAAPEAEGMEATAVARNQTLALLHVSHLAAAGEPDKAEAAAD